MKQKLLLFCFSLVFLVGTGYSQSVSVKGKVQNENGQAVAAATVKLKGTNQGTLTDDHGEFKINAEEGQTLVITAIGYNVVEVPAKSDLTVTLITSDAQAAGDDVVVIGYGTGQKISSVVGSVVTVSGKELQERPVANAFDALQGKVAGLQVFTSSGEPSALSSLRIHGVGSLGASSTPLYVLDGVPIDGSAIIAINPNDIESVSVLKDASATSIYGSRAANGVIYLTTKKGSRNESSTITADVQYGISNLASTTAFNNLMNTKELTDLWVETGYYTQEDVDDLLKDYPNDTKWYKQYYKRNAPTFQANLSVNGGNKKTSYFISGNFFRQEGLAARSGYKKYSLRSNVNSNVTDWLKLGVNLFGTYDWRESNPYGSNSTNRGLAMLAQPFFSPYDEDGKKIYGKIPGWGRYAPNYLADKLPSPNNKLQLNPTGYIQINPLQNLTFKTQAGIDFYDYRSSSYQLPSYAASLDYGNVYESFERAVGRTITNTIEYKFSLEGGHNFTILGGQEFTDKDITFFDAYSAGQTDDRLIMLQNGPEKKAVNSSKTEYAYNSYFGRLDYNWGSKYYINASVRNDASSRFGIDNRNATFWSAGAMWKISNEAFMDNVSWVSDLTLRASIGTSGNSDIGNYQSLATVGTNQYDGQTGWIINSPGNPQLAWESQRQTNIGLAFNLFKRAFVDVQFYDRVTDNMLIDVPYPYTSGFDQVTSNVGSMKNTGIDFSLSVDAYKSKDAYITPYVNFNYNKDKVTDLFQGKDYWIIPNTGVCWVVGQPVSFFYPIWAGVNSETGEPQWYNPSDNIAVSHQDKNDVTSDFDEEALQQNTGIKRFPPFTGGFGLKAGYKGFFFTVDFSFAQGKYLINNENYFFNNPNVFTGFNQNKVVADYWKQPGDVTEFPSYDYQFTQFDSRLIENASFMRLKNATFGYVVPQQMLERTKILKSAQIYFSGRNLITVTNYTGPDPEVDSNLTLGANPNTKQYTFGVTVTF